MMAAGLKAQIMIIGACVLSIFYFNQNFHLELKACFVMPRKGGSTLPDSLRLAETKPLHRKGHKYFARALIAAIKPLPYSFSKCAFKYRLADTTRPAEILP